MDLGQILLDRPEPVLPSDGAGVFAFDDFLHSIACILSEGLAPYEDRCERIRTRTDNPPHWRLALSLMKWNAPEANTSR